MNDPKEKILLSPLPGKESEAQRGEGTCPKSQT